MNCGVLHGNRGRPTRNAADFGRFGVVAFLHPVLAGNRARSGIGLPEVIVAVTVAGIGILGVAAMGSAARRLANVAAVRSAQTLVASRVLDGTPADAQADVEAVVDTIAVAPGLIELHVTVSGSGSVGQRSWVARRRSSGP